MLREISISTFLFIFLLSFNVYSLGIGPSGPVYMPDVNFGPNLRIERDIIVFNTEDYFFPVEMELDGNLTEYATLSEYRFTLSPNGQPGSSKTLKFTLNLPEKLEKPGSYLVAIRAAQVVGGEPGQPGALGGRVRVAVGFYVHVPYPGKYLETGMRIENPEVNQTITFIIDAINRGNETIENAEGTVQVYDSQNNFVVSIKTDKKSINPDQTVELKAEWPAFNINPGEYGAAAVIDYDGFKTTIQKDFRIGSPTAKILNVTAQPIVNGTVGMIKTTVMSYWSDKIDNAYVTITAKRGSYSGGSQSPSMILRPWERIEFTNFWDTSDAIGPGEYQGIATLYYLNKTDTMEFTLKITEQPGFAFSDLMLIALVILIVIFAVMIFLTFRKKKKFVQKKLA
jgi:hypothetical protein